MNPSLLPLEKAESSTVEGGKNPMERNLDEK